MEQLIIDLSPKVEQHNPAAGNGRQILRKVYFRVEVPFYTFTFGHSKPEEAKKGEENTRKFFTEIVAMLEADGWTLRDKEYLQEHSGSCPILKKGLQRLYCHPQDISGEVAVENIQAMETLLSSATTFKYYRTDNYRDIIVCTSTDDETKLYHEKHDGTIADIIKAATTTKRCTLYKARGSVEHYLIDKIRIDTIIAGADFTSSVESSLSYAAEHIDRLIAEGWIKTGQGYKGEPLIRWANKAEEKALLKKTA